MIAWVSIEDDRSCSVHKRRIRDAPRVRSAVRAPNTDVVEPVRGVGEQIRGVSAV